jgi:hypothetical protein
MDSSEPSHHIDSGILDQLLCLSQQLFQNSVQQIGSKNPFITSNSPISPAAKLLEAAKVLQTAGLLLEISSTSKESKEEKEAKEATERNELITKSMVKKPSKLSKFSKQIAKPSRNLRKGLDEPIPWTAIYNGILHELKKLEYLNIIFPDDIAVEQVLTYDTFIKSHAYAEFKVHMSNNLIVPIRNAPIYPNKGMCSTSLDNLVYGLLINSIKAGAWQLQMERTADGVKFYTYINNSIKIQKSRK